MTEHTPQQQPTELEYQFHRPWDHQASFTDALANQMRMAPYFLASLALHALIGLLFAGVEVLTPEENKTQIEVLAPPPPPPIEEPEEPPPPPEEKVIEEPVLEEADIVEEAVTQETLEETGDPNFTSDAPFDNSAWNNAVGLGGGAGGKSGIRGGRGGARRGTPTEAAVEDALKWLADHQTEDGYWDCDEFFYWDKIKEEPPSDGPGNAVNDVGVTGLALLAFLGHGDTMSTGAYADQVRRGINWLRDVQLDNGLFGDEVGNPTLYNHSIATMAMGEAYFFGKSPILKPVLEKAVKVIVNSRNPYLAWRYQLEPNGDNDTSITGWMVFALETAKDGGIPVSKDVFDGAEAWFAQITDDNGRSGYTLEAGVGSRPSRKQIYLSRFPPDKSEALTAVALLCRIFMTPEGATDFKAHPQYEVMKKQADLISKTLPLWDEAGGSIDFYYWYYATFAMYQWGDKAWQNWKTAIEKALLPHQRKDGNFKGSWDPQFEPWGDEGGRVYTTALGAIILEVYYRYAPILGAR
ncbi:MAG: hypothetical protein EYC70_07875 [Planctomycetota bacterium]|nr:MAG: hypothetical protein EYC70_07875 [Planctomycetota bacterium]